MCDLRGERVTVLSCSPAPEQHFVAVAFYRSVENPCSGIFLKKSCLLKVIWKKGENLFVPLIFFVFFLFRISCFFLCARLSCSVLINIIVIMLFISVVSYQPHDTLCKVYVNLLRTLYELWVLRYFHEDIL